MFCFVFLFRGGKGEGGEVVSARAVRASGGGLACSTGSVLGYGLAVRLECRTWRLGSVAACHCSQRLYTSSQFRSRITRPGARVGGVEMCIYRVSSMSMTLVIQAGGSGVGGVYPTRPSPSHPPTPTHTHPSTANKRNTTTHKQNTHTPTDAPVALSLSPQHPQNIKIHTKNTHTPADAPVALKLSPPISTRTVVRCPRASSEQQARKCRTTSS